MKASEPVSAPIPRRRLERGLWVSILASATSMPWFAAAMGMPITMLMECLGGSAVAVGLVVTISQLSTVAQIPVALACQRLASRKPLWFATAFLHRLLWVVPVLLLLMHEPRTVGVRIVLLATLALSALLAQIGAPLWFSWMGDLVPDRLRARFWGKRQTVVMVAHLLAVIGFGELLDFFPDPRSEGGGFTGFVIVFGIAAVAGLLDICVHWFVPEPRQVNTAQQGSWLRRALAPLQDADFRWVTLAFGAWMFSLGLVGSFSILYLTRRYGVSYTGLSATMISASLGTVVAGMVWGGLMQIMGGRSFGTIMFLLSPLFGLVWFFMAAGDVTVPYLGVTMAKPVFMLVCVNFFAGALYSGVGLTQVDMVTATTRSEGRTISMAVHWTLVGALGCLGPIVGGVLTDWFELHPVAWTTPTGAPVGFIHLLVVAQMLVVWLICLPALLKVRRLQHDLPIPLLVGNPLRAAGLLMGLSALTRAASRPTRVKAVQRLGRRGDASVVGELTAKMDDPDRDVREAAVQALGELGTDTAVDQLVHRLADDEDELSPQIARALRKARHPGGVDALVRRLGVPDRETQTESARALGEIGDRRAVGSLKALVRQSWDETLVSASGEALARLGVLEAVYDLLPRMRRAKRPALRRSLAVALGDLMGRSDTFYALLVREEKDRGAALGGLQRRVRRYVKRMTTERELRDRLCRQIEEASDAYERDDCSKAIHLLHSLVVQFAQIVGGNDTQAPEHEVAADLMRQSPRLGVAYWFLNDLAFWGRAAEGRVDSVDVLLGIYVLGELDDSEGFWRVRSRKDPGPSEYKPGTVPKESHARAE